MTAITFKEYKLKCDQVFPDPPEGEPWDDERQEYYDLKIYLPLAELAQVELDTINLADGDEYTEDQERRLLSALCDVLCAATCAQDTEYIDEHWYPQIPFGGPNRRRANYAFKLDHWKGDYQNTNLETAIGLCKGYSFDPYFVMVESMKRISSNNSSATPEQTQGDHDD
jgi:hypothetical protein